MSLENMKKHPNIAYSPVYAARRITASAHIKSRKPPKTIVFKYDGAISLVVMPEHEKIDFEKILKLVSCDSAEV